jgi:hypothetical protein
MVADPDQPYVPELADVIKEVESIVEKYLYGID